MPEPDTTLDIDPEERAERAFHDSESYEFRGVKLEPLTFARDAAVSRLGLTFQGWADSVYLLYLCQTPAERVRKLWTEAEIARWRSDAEEWAEGLRINRGSALANEANELALRIISDRYAAEYRVSAGQPGEPQKKTHEPPARPSLSRVSAKPHRASRRGK